MNSLPLGNLEQRAIEQRSQLHQATAELKAKIVERFDVSRNLRKHVATAAVVVAAIGIVAGYGFGGLLPRR